MKSAGFHVKSKDHLQGIVTLCFWSLGPSEIRVSEISNQTLVVGVYFAGIGGGGVYFAGGWWWWGYILSGIGGGRCSLAEDIVWQGV